MLSKYFVSRGRIRAIRGGPRGDLIEDFAERLHQRGYAEITARRHIRAAEHLVCWALRRGVADRDLDTEALKRFGAHLYRCRCGGGYCCAQPIDIAAGARLFLSHLHGVDEPPFRERAHAAA